MYKKTFIKFITVILSLCVLSSSSGCGNSLYSNFRELESLHVVETIGLDSKNHSLTLTVSTGSLEDNSLSHLSGEGRTIMDSIQAVRNISPKEELYFSHVKYALLGKSILEDELSDFLSFVQRSTRLRMDTALFTLLNCPAAEIISGGNENFEITNALSSLERTIKKRGDNYPFTAREVSMYLNEYGSALICALNAFQGKDKEVRLVPEGFAIIKDFELIGYLNKTEALGASILLNKIGEGPLTFNYEKDNTVSLLIEDSSREYKVNWGENGEIKELDVKINLSLGLGECTKPIDPKNKEVRKKLSNVVSQHINEYCLSTLKRLLDDKADFLGLKGEIRRIYPNETAQLSTNFINLLENAKINVDSCVEITSGYELKEPSQHQEESKYE